MSIRKIYSLSKISKSKMSSTAHHRMDSCIPLYKTMWFIAVVTFQINVVIASHDLLPHPCDTVKCPPMEELSCPIDSELRTGLQTIPSFQTLNDATEANHSAENIEFFAQCCLAQKCICKTCYIPDCNTDGEVVVELRPESIETPGLCCGQYECRKEPNCTEIRDTENYWLTDCQRCKCYSGQRMCHQSCDEEKKKANAMCNSKSLNMFFEHGDSWKDGCYECECVYGEQKCVMPFCRSVNCPTHRQVLLKDSCCPICWPKGIPMPNGDEDYGDDNESDPAHQYDDNEDDIPIAKLPPATEKYAENEVDTIPNIKFDRDSSSVSTEKGVTTTIQTTSETYSSTDKKAIITTNDALQSTTIGLNTTIPPCMPNPRQDAPATYQVYPEVVEVVRQTYQSETLYGVIVILVLIIIFLIWYNIHLRTQKRSYRPVSNFDDNFNKMSNIKKMNEFA